VDGRVFKDHRGCHGVEYGWGNSRIFLLEAATNFLKVFNMSANMVRRGGRVQLEQSDMRLALNMATMAKGGFSRAAIEETQQLIEKPCAEVREEKKQGVECPGLRKVKAAIERHPAMVYENHMHGCLPCQMAQQRIHRHAGGVKEPAHLHRAGGTAACHATSARNASGTTWWQSWK